MTTQETSADESAPLRVVDRDVLAGPDDGDELREANAPPATTAARAAPGCCCAASSTATPAAPPAPPPPPPPAPLTEDEIFARKTLAELNAERPLAQVLFDFDQFVIREDQRPTLQKNADWLRRWTSTRITVEGHADSRGTNEYNLGLGERRANAIRTTWSGSASTWLGWTL
jgi:outer membrane protein OmpA-like peptidoglycan-associated protein